MRRARSIGVSRAAQSPTVTVAPGAALVRNSGNTAVSSSTLNPPVHRRLLRCRSICRTRSTSGAGSDRPSPRRASARRPAPPIGRPWPLSLQAELALDYFELRSADAQRRCSTRRSRRLREALQLTTNRFEGGAASQSDVAQAKTQLEATRVQATDIGVQRARYEHAIAALLGQPPSALSLARCAARHDAARRFPPACRRSCSSGGPTSPSAERRAAEANERVGIARTVVLSVADPQRDRRLRRQHARQLVGVAQPVLGDWSGRACRPCSMAASGAPSPRRRLAAYDATVAEYRQAALTAFQQVEDNLAALRILEQEARQQDAATAVGAGVAAHLERSLSRGRRSVPPGAHRADDRAGQRAQRRRHHAPPDGRERPADQVAGRRLDGGRAAGAVRRLRTVSNRLSPWSEKASAACSVPIARSLERVGEWWSILILRDAFAGLTRFDQFQKSLDIAPNMLTRRLKSLVEAGLLERRRYSDRPPRYEYVLTERGHRLPPGRRRALHVGQQALRAGRRERRADGYRDRQARGAGTGRSSDRPADRHRPACVRRRTRPPMRAPKQRMEVKARARATRGE